jgi:hypothetical protein
MPLTQVKALKTRLFPGLLFFGQDGDPDGSGHIMILGNDDLLIQNLFKGRDHPLVEGRSSLEKDSISDTAVSDHPVQIILNNGVTQPGDEIIHWGPSLLVMNQIGFDEDGTSFSHPNRVLG